MAKKSKEAGKPVEKVWNYLKQTEFKFDGNWFIDGKHINGLPSRLAGYFFAHAASQRSPLEFYNVEKCSHQIFALSSYEELDLIRSWVDMLCEYTSCALYSDIYKNTEGPEKVKYKAADLAMINFMKEFQGV